MMTFIKRTAGVLALACLLALSTGAPARAQGLGFVAGLNFSSQSDIVTGSARATFQNATGYHVGLDYQLGLGPVALRPGILYHRIGAYRFPDGQDLTLSSLEIPVDVELRLLPIPMASPYVVAAPVLTFPKGEGALGDGVQSAAMTGDVGVGVDLAPPLLGVRLMPELRYSFGLSDFLKKSFTVGGTTIEPSGANRRIGNFMVRLHVYF